MQWKDNGLGFSPVTLVLHWLGAALVFGLIAIELTVAMRLQTIGISLQPYRNLLWVVLFFVSCYRLRARLTSVHPLPVGVPSPVEVIISRSVAMALILAGVLLPIAHLLSVATSGNSFALPGDFEIQMPLAPNPSAKAVISVLYAIGTTAALIGLALHIFGAMKNHFILKNDTLLRMLGKKVEL